jgi:NAD(P)H-dependent FMN reductase
MATQAPDGIDIAITDLVGQLPIFNPDSEGERTPPSVLAFARQIGEADGLIIACPEYAHGIPGGLKNALDWMVSRDEIPFKPVMLVRASTRSDIALGALQDVLRTMSLDLMPDVGFAVHLLGKASEQMEAMFAGAGTQADTRDAIERFADRIRASRPA